MAYPKEQFNAGDLRLGVRVQTSEFDPTLTLDAEETVNISTGIESGWGPRQGMAPLPGHSDKETRTLPRCNGLANSEASAGGNGLLNRIGAYAIVPILMDPYDGTFPKVKKQSYLYLTGLKPASTEYFDASFGAVQGGSLFKHTSDLASGLAESSYYQESPLQRRHKLEQLQLPLTATSADVEKFLKKWTKRYMSWSQIAIAGKRVPMQWMIGGKVGATPTSSNPPDLNLWTATFFDYLGSPTVTTFLGTPSEFITGNPAADSSRTVYYQALDANGDILDIYWRASITSANIASIPEYGPGAAYNGVTGATKTGVGTSFGQIVASLVNDPKAYTNSAYEAVLIAAERPLAIIVQDWLVNANGMKPQWFDLTDPTAVPRLFTTLIPASAFPYQNLWTLAGANTGVLRAFTTYEIGYSYYCKRLDYETNVQFGAQVEIDAGDNNSIDLTAGLGLTNVLTTPYSAMRAIANHIPPWEYSSSKVIPAQPEEPRLLHINDWELRFYYRELGTQEWLPGVFIDAAKYWFRSWFFEAEFDNVRIASAPVAGPVGGRPGGFVDYSTLPKQQYLCSVIYKNRAFWFSEKSAHFSLQNNIFAYPAANSINATDGVWRGGIVHIQPGETFQTSRLVMFGSNASYVARFTGVKQQVQVRVSADAVGEFELDGSDLVIDDLCDATAYSFRAAAVAEGVLYWWGQQGVYRDDGISSPVNVSRDQLEPRIFNLVDTTKIDEVHAVYNRQTKEIFWFYPPKTPDSYVTHALVLNVNTGEFFPAKWRQKIDWAQTLKVERDDTASGHTGERIIVGARETASTENQRVYFLDQLQRSGDVGPKTDFVVKQISTPSAGVRRLMLATGFDATNLATIVAGDNIALQRTKAYATSLTAVDDMVALVNAVNVGSGFIDITLPAGATMDGAATLALPALYFPIWHSAAAGAGLNGITWKWKTRYWVPGGMDFWAHWIFIHMLYKINLWKSTNGTSFDLTYRSPVSGSTSTNVLTLSDNSDGHYQVLTHLKIGVRSAQGQGLKLDMSGVHIGSEWVLQYLKAYATPIIADNLMEFEG